MSTRLIIAAAVLVGVVAGLYISVQLQWALIEVGLFNTTECRDVIIQPLSPSPSCLGPRPTLLPTVIGAVVGGLVAYLIARRVAIPKDDTKRS